MGIEVFQKVNAVANLGNSPSLMSGNFADRPVSAANGSVYISWDTNQIFAYVSGTWETLGGGGGVVGADNGLTLSGGGLVELGGTLLFDTPITNNGFSFYMDQINPTLLQLSGQIIQDTSVPPSFGAYDFSLQSDMLMYSTNGSNWGVLRLFNNTTKTQDFIIRGPSQVGWLWIKDGPAGTKVAEINIAGVFYIGNGAGNNVAANNGDIWNFPGGSLAAGVFNAFGKFTPLNGTNTEIWNAASGGFTVMYLSGGADGGKVSGAYWHNSGRMTIKSGGSIADIPSARLAITSTTEGFAKPRMTNAQMLAISSPIDGLEVYNTDFKTDYLFVASIPAWQAVSAVSYGDVRNASNFGLSASLANAGSYAVPASSDTTFTVGAWLNLLTVVTDTITVQVAFTDNHGTARVLTFFPQGAVTAAIGAAGYYGFSPMYFRAQAGTTVQVSTTVTGAGSILYEVGAIITKVNGN